MKKALSILMAALLLVALFAGCAKPDTNTTQPSAADNTVAQDEATSAQDTAPDPQPTDPESQKELNVVLYANGNFGDNAYFDGNKAGILRAQDELGIKAKLIEGGSAQADYQSGIEALAASGEYDIIVTLTGKTSDIVYDLAEKYPDQTFFVLDTTMTNVRPNIFNAMYNQSEGAFLAGAFAAMVTTSTELEGTNPDKVIGFVGVMDSPTINDFYSGYEQGAHYVDSEINVLKAYVGDAVNAPKAKELASAMYNSQNADIVFNVGASAGLGTLEAGSEAGKYTIGVDINQNGLYPGSVLTSMLKESGNGIYNAIKMYQEGTLEMGTSVLWGIKDGCIGLAKDELFEQYVPEDIRTAIDEIEQKLIAGEITVTSELY